MPLSGGPTRATAVGRQPMWARDFERVATCGRAGPGEAAPAAGQVGTEIVNAQASGGGWRRWSSPTASTAAACRLRRGVRASRVARGDEVRASGPYAGIGFSSRPGAWNRSESCPVQECRQLVSGPSAEAGCRHVHGARGGRCALFLRTARGEIRWPARREADCHRPGPRGPRPDQGPGAVGASHPAFPGAVSRRPVPPPAPRSTSPRSGRPSTPPARRPTWRRTGPR